MHKFLLALALAAPTATATDLARITLDEPTDLPTLQLHGFDLVNVHKEHPTLGEFAPPAVDLFLHRGDRQKLRALGFRAEIVQEDYEQFLAQRLTTPYTHVMAGGPPSYGQGAMGGYYTFAEIVNVIDHYVATFPSIVSQKQAIGTTHEGRTIWAFKISDNPNATENEPRVLFDALHHAREPMSAHTLLWIVDHLTANYGGDPKITQLVDEREIWFVPCVNPDGYVYNEATNPGGGGLWRKNRRNNAGSCEGVDLNRNYPTAWGVDNQGSSNDPCSETFRGLSSASEPETQAMDAFLTGKNFKTAWSMHTFGEWMVEPYGWQNVSPGPVYAEYSADMVAFNGYTPGIGYSLLYPANGIAVDHYNDVHGCVAYTPEIGYDFWPNIADAVAIAEQNLEPALLMIEYAGSWLSAVDVTVSELGDLDGAFEPGEGGSIVVTVRNKGQSATTGGTVTLTSSTFGVFVSNPTAPLAALPPLTNTDNSAQPLTFAIGAAAGPGTDLGLQITLSDGVLSSVIDVPLTIGTLRTILRDDLEAERNWTIGDPADQATAGIWERADPNQVTQNGAVTQPADDATPAPGTMCYVTGNDASSVGSDDVDGDTTTLTTPRFDLSGALAPVIRYQRHFYISGTDPFIVSISNDDGQNWHEVSTLLQTANQWTAVEFKVADFVLPTDQMRVRFQTKDEPNNSITEAAVDDFEVLDYGIAPHLGVSGTTAIGQTFDLQLAGTPGNLFLLYFSTGTGAASVFGIEGMLGLNPANFAFLLSANMPAAGLASFALPIPNNGALVGFSAYFQAIGDVPPATFSNVAGITITNP